MYLRLKQTRKLKKKNFFYIEYLYAIFMIFKSQLRTERYLAFNKSSTNEISKTYFLKMHSSATVYEQYL